MWLVDTELCNSTSSSFQTPLTPKVTSSASTITCYTKYSPPAQHAGQLHSKSGTTKKENQLCSSANCSNTHNIISLMAPHKFSIILRTTKDEFNILSRTTLPRLFYLNLYLSVVDHRCRRIRVGFSSCRGQLSKVRFLQVCFLPSDLKSVFVARTNTTFVVGDVVYGTLSILCLILVNVWYHLCCWRCCLWNLFLFFV